MRRNMPRGKEEQEEIQKILPHWPYQFFTVSVVWVISELQLKALALAGRLFPFSKFTAVNRGPWGHRKNVEKWGSRRGLKERPGCTDQPLAGWADQGIVTLQKGWKNEEDRECHHTLSSWRQLLLYFPPHQTPWHPKRKKIKSNLSFSSCHCLLGQVSMELC